MATSTLGMVSDTLLSLLILMDISGIEQEFTYAMASTIAAPLFMDELIIRNIVVYDDRTCDSLVYIPFGINVICQPLLHL